MNFFENYYKNVIKYDLLNKFSYKKITQIPEIKKIILNFGCKKFDLKCLVSSILTLELITLQKSIVTNSNIFNISFKIKKGNLVGCKISIRKTLMLNFITKLITDIFPRIKQFNGFYTKNKNYNIKTITFSLKNLLIFPELKNQYLYFKNLPILNITIVTNVTRNSELYFLLKSFKFPIN